MTYEYGERICESCKYPYTALSPHSKYCSWKCNRRAARQRRAMKPASDNWRPEITRAPMPSSEATPIAESTSRPLTPEEEEQQKKQAELNRLFPPITGDEALKSTGYTTQRPAIPTEEKKHEEGKED